MSKVWKIKEETELESVIEELLPEIKLSRKVIFKGDLGAGKTTFIKTLCVKLGVIDTVNSPTYAIINSYETVNGEAIYHYDFYRVKNEREALDLGIEEQFDSSDFCFIEWPEKIENFLPVNHVTISISVEDDYRIIKFDT